MGKSLRKILRREIRGSFSRFLSILVMVSLGTMFLVGLRSAAPDMRSTADSYFDSQCFMDIQVISTLGLTESDVEALGSVAGVALAEGGWSMDGIVTLEERELMVKAISLSDKGINAPILREGRLPENDDECVVDRKFLENFGVSVGDRIMLQLGSEQSEGLAHEQFLVVGAAESPLYISIDRGTGGLGDGNIDAFVLLPRESFTMEEYTLCTITATGAADLNAYSQEYEDQIDALETRLEEKAKELGQSRYASLLEDGEQQITQGQTELDAQRSEAEAEIAEQESRLAESRQSLDQGWTELEETRANGALAVSMGLMDEETLTAQLEEAENTLNGGEAQYEAGAAALETARGELTQRLQEGEDALKEARETLSQLEPAEIYVLDRNTNYGFVSYAQNADRMGNLAKMFPLIFFAVAALVCLTTMTRMVEEERTEIGSIKAMGYGTWAITGKYLLYGTSAAFLGGVIGILIGTLLIPWVIYTSYGILYNLPGLELKLYWKLAASAMATGIACIAGATLWAMLATARETPAALMRPKAPQAGKRIFLEHLGFLWHRFSFSVKVSCRNLFRYKKRLLMTVMGIAGCTALMIAGIGLRNSIFGIIDMQYDEIYAYDLQVSLDPEKDPAERVCGLLQESGQTGGIAPCAIKSVTAQTDTTVDCYLFATDAPEKVYEAIDLRNMESGNHLDIPREGVLIDKKLSELLNVHEGDEITIQAGTLARVPVVGIVEQYVRHYIYMTGAYYETCFGEAYSPSELLVTVEGADETALSELAEQLLKTDGVLSASNTAAAARSFEDTLKTINAAVMIIILSAAALALVVLYNLTNINITERIRELATIKVLGFYDGEVAMYIYRENTVLTILGIALGNLFGKYLRRFLVGTIELDIVMFGRIPKAEEYIIATVLSLGFALIVNVMMYFRMKGIDMIQSLKSVE